MYPRCYYFYLMKEVLGLGLSLNFGAGKEDIIEVAATVDKFIRFNKRRLASHELVIDIISHILLSLNNPTSLLPKKLKKSS